MAKYVTKQFNFLWNCKFVAKFMTDNSNLPQNSNLWQNSWLNNLGCHGIVNMWQIMWLRNSKIHLRQVIGFMLFVDHGQPHLFYSCFKIFNP